MGNAWLALSEKNPRDKICSLCCGEDYKYVTCGMDDSKCNYMEINPIPRNKQTRLYPAFDNYIKAVMKRRRLKLWHASNRWSKSQTNTSLGDITHFHSTAWWQRWVTHHVLDTGSGIHVAPWTQSRHVSNWCRRAHPEHNSARSRRQNEALPWLAETSCSVSTAHSAGLAIKAN